MMCRNFIPRWLAMRALPVFLILIAAVLPATVAAAQHVRIGVLSFRSLAQTNAQWVPTAAWLETELPEYQFQIVPMYHAELTKAVEQQRVDFVITNPEHYVLMRSRYGLSASATLLSLAGGHPSNQFGGVVFTRADRTDLVDLIDLKGKKIAAPGEWSLGGYLAQHWTLHKAGVNLDGDVRMAFTGMPHDKAVIEVLNGNADAGFVRTGIIEAMQREGKVAPGQLRVMQPQPANVFPLAITTDLYPEWSFAVLRHVPEPLAKSVTLALFRIPPQSSAAQAGNYYGFSPPGDYSAIEAIMARLRLHPDRREFGLREVYEKYSVWIGGLLGVLLVSGAIFTLFLGRSNRRLSEALAEAERLALRDAFLESLGEGVWGVDRSGNCIFINPAALSMLDYRREEVIGHNAHALFHHHYPDGSVFPEARCPVSMTLADGRRREGEQWFLRKNGSAFPVQSVATAIVQDGEVVGAVVAFQDITERKRIDDELRIAAIAFDSQEGMIVADARGVILRVNQAFVEVTGYSMEEAVGQTPALLKSGVQGEAFYQEMWAALTRDGQWQGEIWNRRKNGEVYPEWLTITAVRAASGEVTHYVAAFLDISRRKAREEEIRSLAFYDPLTQLPNRRMLLDRLKLALAASNRSTRHGALLFIDLDNFKTLNDSLGHDVGDLLLIDVAKRLQGCVREGDTVSRLGGDEFVVMLEDLSEKAEEAAAQAEQVGEKILAVLNRPYELAGHECHSTPSIGISLIHDHDDTVEDLLKQADLAMYQAKAGGRNALRFFDPVMQSAVQAHLEMESQLRRALQRGEFIVHYQPQVDGNGHMVCAEALLRWQHPQRGMVSPAEFIPLAEETGLILPIGEWVLETACEQLESWQTHPVMKALTLAVNISVRQFRQEHFVEQVQSILQRSGANPARLKLEITESMLLDDVEGAIRKMTLLKALGVHFSLDDFGTGYSSLSYLKRLPLDQIKIDQSFVREILVDANDAAIAQMIIGLGRVLGLAVVAEGVETEAQHDFLAQHGCQLFQGWLFGRPQPAEALEALMQPATV